MQGSYRQRLVSAVTFLGGIYFFLEFVLPEKIGAFEFGRYHEQISTGAITVGTMAIGLGIINVLRIHGAALLKGSRGWRNSLALLLGLFTMLATGIFDFVNAERSLSSWKSLADLQTFPRRVEEDYRRSGVRGEPRIAALAKILKEHVRAFPLQDPAAAAAPASADAAPAPGVPLALSLQTSAELVQAYAAHDSEDIAALTSSLAGHLKAATDAVRTAADAGYKQSRAKQVQELLEEGFFFPLGAAMFSLLAFYIATAAYRTFRAKSLEASVMMLAAILVMLGQIPHGPRYVYAGLPAIRLWLLENISTPVFRAIFFGAAIAGLAMAVRMWLSLDRSPLSSGDQQ